MNLSECEETSRNALMRHLTDFNRKFKDLKGRLNFLLTSRPHFDIIRLLDNQTICLSGDDKSERVQYEIDIYIQAHLKGLQSVWD